MSGFIGGGVIGGAAPANAVNFDGNDYLSRGGNLTGISSAKTATLSFWIFRTQTTFNCLIEGSATSTSTRFRAVFNATTGRMQVLAYNSAGTAILDVTTTVSLTASDWRQVMLSFDLSNTSNRSLYIDGAAHSPTWTTYTDDNIDFSSCVEWTIGAFVGGAGKLTGDVSEFFFNNTYTDFSVEANRRLYLPSSGKAIQRNINAIIRLSGETASWHNNKGSGGGFTENGALTDSSNLPVEL